MSRSAVAVGRVIKKMFGIGKVKKFPPPSAVITIDV
jgi:hypothetical protein